MIKTLIFTFVLLCLSNEAHALDFRDRNLDDPSKKLSCEQRDGVPLQKPEWYRILGDFNNDGLTDIAISTSTSLFGNAGGWFDIYIGTNDGRYQYIGNLSAHPDAINVKAIAPGETLVTTYHHGSASAGVLSKQKIGKNEIIDISNVEISPGGNEKDKRLYESLFKSRVNLKIQKSYCENNQVKWRELR